MRRKKARGSSMRTHPKPRADEDSLAYDFVPAK